MTIAAMHAQPRRSERWDWRAGVRTLAVQAVLVIAAFQAYRAVRILAEGGRARAFDHSELLLRFEESIGLDIEKGIQSIVLRSETMIDAFNRIYVWSFWPTVTATLPILFVAARRQYRHYRNALFISGGIGLVVFAIFPVAPPRMLDGFVDTVHVFSSSTSIARPGAFTNQYAAMPSFHVGWLVLAGVVSMPALPWRRARPLLLLPGLVMTVTVMATANHYFIDAIVGAAVALGGLYVSYHLPSRQAVGGWVNRKLEPVGGFSGLVASAGRGALVALIALAGGRVTSTYREAIERSTAGASEAPDTHRRNVPVSQINGRSRRGTVTPLAPPGVREAEPLAR